MSAQSLQAGSGDPTTIDRRAFIGTVGAAAGALVVASIAPLAVAGGAPPDGALPRWAPGMGTEEAWDVDDICGHSPRYAHPIPHAPSRSSPVMWECVDPIDRMLV